MSQVSGSIAFEFPIERIGREVAASVIEYIGRPEVLDAIGAAIAARMSVTHGQTPAEPATDPQADRGGFPLGGRHRGGGDPFYDRGADL